MGLAVASGAAHGIDAAAHRGALQAGGRTIAVLGSGIDIAYPASSRDLLGRIVENGTLVSEYPPATPAGPHHFPARNRIVVALARALVVVEGEAKSGSRISVDHALDLGREIFAVPGPVTSPLAETPLEMIRDGATLIRGAEDLLDDLGLDRLPPPPPPPDLGDDERRVWDSLAGRLLPDAVARRAGMSVPAVVTTLIQLELRGLVASAADGTSGAIARRRPAERRATDAVYRLTGGVRVAAGGWRRPHEEPCAPPFRLIHTGDIHPSWPGACMPQGLPRTEIDLLAGFEDHLALERRLSPHTVTAYRGDLEQLGTFLTRNRASLASAPYPLLRRFLAQQHTLGFARATIARRVGAIKTFYRWMASTGRIEADPSLLLGSPKVVNRLPSVLRPKEAEILAEGPVVVGEGLERAVGLRDRAALELLYGSGLRVGEVATLTLDRVDVDQRPRPGARERIEGARVTYFRVRCRCPARLPGARTVTDGSGRIASALLQSAGQGLQ